MLPDVDAQQRRRAVRDRAVLLGVEITARLEPSGTRNAQPEPNWPAPAALSLALKASKEPNALSSALRSSPLGSPPPPGEIHFQKSEWL